MGLSHLSILRRGPEKNFSKVVSPGFTNGVSLLLRIIRKEYWLLNPILILGKTLNLVLRRKGRWLRLAY